MLLQSKNTCTDILQTLHGKTATLSAPNTTTAVRATQKSVIGRKLSMESLSTAREILSLIHLLIFPQGFILLFILALIPTKMIPQSMSILKLSWSKSSFPLSLFLFSFFFFLLSFSSLPPLPTLSSPSLLCCSVLCRSLPLSFYSLAYNLLPLTARNSNCPHTQWDHH